MGGREEAETKERERLWGWGPREYALWGPEGRGRGLLEGDGLIKRANQTAQLPPPQAGPPSCAQFDILLSLSFLLQVRNPKAVTGSPVTFTQVTGSQRGDHECHLARETLSQT